MAKVDPQILTHKEWLGLLQPVGLVVAPVALVKGQAVPSKNVAEQQRTLIEVTGGTEGTPKLNFERFALDVLEWQAEDLVGSGATEIPSELDVALTEYREVLSPTFAVPDPAEDGKWLLLVKVVDDDIDRATDASKQGWHTSPQVRFERLLRDNEVPIGILANNESVRLVYAPTGESSGHLTFPVGAMREVAGRPILAALLMLLGSDRLFTLPDDRRLPTLLSESRKYQNVVSTELSQQVLRALGELLRGFQAADNAMNGDLLHDAMREDPQHVYGGLITVLMRLVFLLYAEERDLLPGEDVYQEHYSVTGLFEKLRADAALYPDTMDQRYGAWARLLSLFRLIFDGGQHGSMRLPARQGQLFHPDEYPFLEGRPYRSVRQLDELLSPPRVSDGTVYRVLEDLLVLEGERLSYRTLDVEQIGSVYEAIMGFEVKRAAAPSIAVRPEHVVINLQAILDAKPAQRAKILKTDANCSVPKGASKELKDAKSVDELVAALSSRISPQTPTVLPAGALFLQPTEERRRSGSHYTPRSLTEPIVRTTLRPVLEDLGDRPLPEQILDLNVCDPAMGSGAFLVETCRHLADKLADAWNLHAQTPELPPDEDAILHARRLVAQRCLYGVDKNPFAVNLAKLSLWLVTLARDHAFTFLDHSLKHGDSLVGLTRKQVAAFHWDEGADQDLPIFQLIAKNVGRARTARTDILALGDENEAAKRVHHRDAEEALEEARLTGDLVISAFFSADKDKAREARRHELWKQVQDWREGKRYENDLRGIVEQMRGSARPVVPFHWEIEFPEVFDRENPGFNAFVGNPPFLGGAKISANLSREYLDWLLARFVDSGGQADLVAYFFRTTFDHLRDGGALGLIATNTIAQGDTRLAGLRWITEHGGRIFSATRRFRWPGIAAVVVSVVHLSKGRTPTQATLNGRPVPKISAFLFGRGGDHDPHRLAGNKRRSFKGSMPYGQGFIFEDGNPGATPLAEMTRLLSKDPRNAERIFPYIGGSEVNTSPTHAHHRWVINFGEMSLAEASEWPELMEIVEAKVRPERERNKRESRRKYWWRFGESTPALYAALDGLSRVLVCAQTSKYRSFVFLPPKMVYDQKVVVLAFDSLEAFAVLQSRPHVAWSRFFGSTMKDDPVYTPSDCFETYPFPDDWAGLRELREAGAALYEHRQNLLRTHTIGLTTLYNSFHDPETSSEEIIKLRELHDAMDRRVLDAYGWDDVIPTCEFLLDYEEDVDEASNKRRKPWRYRWPDETEEEVLSRLLDLNQRQAEDESLAGTGASRRGASADSRKGNKGSRPPEGKAKKATGKRGRKSKKPAAAPASDSQINMFREDLE